MKKALGQTVRDLKREVNKKVLKVPSIEQKVLDATSNEPWGPHGSHLADIAQATRNYHEYQMVMSVIWKRINDTGKNWRHVYKALTVLEYLVAHGSERVIDEIREHAYQISTLSDFQYIDSSGRDQGSNVRKKSQGLVVLVNDKDRIQEARQKAAATRDKYRNTSMGGMYKPSSYSSGGGYGERYDDDRYEGRYGYGREREWGSRDDDRYGKYGDYGSRDGDRYGRESEDSYAQDGYRDDDSRGRSRSMDDYNYGSRSRSADRDRDRSYEDDGQYSSSRVSGVKADDHSQDGRRLDRKYSEPSLGGPPSYEEAVGDARSPTYSERDGEPSAAPAHASKSSSPPQNPSYLETTTSSIPAAAAQPAAAAPVSAPSPVPTPSAPSPAPAPAPAPAPSPAPGNKEFDGFDEFDPRGPFSAVPTSSNGVDMDFLGSLSDSFSSNSLAIVPNTTSTAISESDAVTNSVSGNAYPLESTASIQFEDPFGNGPFKAISSTDSFPAQPSGTNHSEPPQLSSQSSNTVGNFGLGDTDILADILPPSGPSPTGFQAQTVQPVSQTGFQGQIDLPGQSSSQASFPGQMGLPSSTSAFPHQSVQPGTNYYGSFNQQLGSTAPVVQPMAPQNPTGPHAQYTTTNLIPESGPQAGFSAAMTSAPSLTASANSLAIVPQPAKDTKFETKSTVWVDTLNRGLVNLNISGSKTNPLADIGVDFDAINRKDRRMEKPSQTPVVSTITMGKAMGSGSGIGRAGAGAIRGAPNPMMGSGMSGMGMGGGRGSGMGMVGGPVAGVGMGMGGGYVNQPMGGMGMGQGFQMQQRPTGFPPRSFTPGVYNTVMGPGNYVQQPYNGGYR